MQKAKLLFYLFILLIAVTGCETSDSTLDPPQTEEQLAITSPAPGTEATAEIAPEPSATSTPEGTSTIPLTPSPESTALEEPTSAPSPEPIATPTETPIPTNPVSSISLVPVIEGAFVLPVYLTHAGDGRLFIVEQAGVVHIIEDGQLIDTPFLDIRDRVGSSQLEQGLLGLAFHPDYDENGAFFVNYTNKGGNTHIARFLVDRSDPNKADADSEVLLLTFQQPFPNHNGGQIAFGPDGYLYIGIGDGGSANDPLNSGQNPATILGTILRLDVDLLDAAYRVPAANPFVDDDAGLNEVWAWGLRNPWRFSFDRVTGDLFIADVGQNLWEEVHFQPADSPGGENYGWNILEGSHCFLSAGCDTTGLELPIFEYQHEQGCSITGGYMYRGASYPSLYGNYLVADFCQGTIWRLFPEESGEWSSAVVYDGSYVISSFGEDAAGELYVLDHTGGSVYQIIP